MKKISIAFIVFLATAICWSCTKQVTSYVPEPAPFYYPGIYNFQGVNYSAQKEVVDSIDQLMAAIDSGNTQGIPVDSATVANMFNNDLAGFCTAVPSPTPQSDILQYIGAIATASHSVVPGQDGVAGVGTSTLTPATYLQTSNGFVYRELVKASIMGGLLAYQIETIHLGDSINTSITVPVLQRNWDAAFGYFDVPIDFPTDTTGSNYWGRYAKNLSVALGSDTTIMTNFLIGRAAINNGFIINSSVLPNITNYSAIGDAANIIAAFNRLAVGAAIYELGQAQTNDSLHDDVVARAHLSSSWGFIHALDYNASLANTTQINSILSVYGNDLYQFNYSYQHVDSIKTVIGNLYGIYNTNF
jgi:Domain of unknown function (DUF4856)